MNIVKRRLVLVVPASTLAVFLSIGFWGLSRAGDDEDGQQAVQGIDAARIIDDSLNNLEGFSAATEQQLKAVGALLEHPDKMTAESLQPYTSRDFRCQALRPVDLQLAFRDTNVSVWRPSAGAATGNGASPQFRGAQGLMQALAEMTAPFHGTHEVHTKFKTFRVEGSGETVFTRAYFHAWGVTDDHAVEQTATWRIEWFVESTTKPPLLRGIEISDFEEVATPEGEGALFSDATLSVFGDSPVFHQQLLQGIDYWRGRLPADVTINFQGHHGLAIGDVNNDGLDDVYLCQPGGLPNRLLLQNGDGTVRDVSAEAGVDWLDRCSSAMLIDLDNDGDQDLIVCMKFRVLFMANDGKARFELRAEMEGPRQPHSLASADYDNDGDLDVYVCGLYREDPYHADVVKGAFALPSPWHDANNGAPNFFYRNNGDFRFEDATESSGLNQNNTRFSHAAGWEDFDNDGDQDLYVANDYGRNNLYRNDGGHFVDVAQELGVEDQAAGMSVAWADYNHDGWMDLYVSNMFSSAGGRIAYHEKFQDRAGEDVRNEFRRHARGNTLFVNSGKNRFDDVSETAAVVLGRWAWSSNFIDINNDTLQDIFVANGFVTNEDTKDL